MIKRTFYIPNEQERRLRRMKEFTVSEHIRRAIHDYLEAHKLEGLNISISQSKSTYGHKAKK
jgi:hypothetical protein